MFDNFHSYVYEPRKLEATEARLQRIYDAAKLGLKGDTLALAAGMRPTEYRQLTMLDPIAEYAEQKGKADGEMELSAILHKAAADGDAKAALEILKHQHGDPNAHHGAHKTLYPAMQHKGGHHLPGGEP